MDDFLQRQTTCGFNAEKESSNEITGFFSLNISLQTLPGSDCMHCENDNSSNPDLSLSFFPSSEGRFGGGGGG